MVTQEQAREDARQRAAIQACQGAVLSQLKTPSVAKFAGLSEVGVRWRDDEENVAAVASFVDSQNSFGAMIRLHWGCEVDVTDQFSPRVRQVVSR